MDFIEAIKKAKTEGRIPVIPDIKAFSPKEGELLRGRDPAAYAKMLALAGAPALSVVTEEKEFHGSLNMLEDVCRSVDLPVLRKDFIEEEADLDETVNAGASAVLLMAAVLGEEKLERLYWEALKRGLMPLVETHTKAELDFALRLGAPLVGINNRNILELERDDGGVSHAAELLQTSHDAFIIVESGLASGDDARTAVRAGGDAVLVGTAILQAAEPAEMFRAMSRTSGLKICGVMDQAGVDVCNKLLADIVGFVVDYPVSVPWNISRGQAASLIRQVKSKSCIVTGGSSEKVLETADALRPDLLQLHYTETLEETKRIAGKLHELGIEVIRSVPTNAVLRKQMFGTESLADTIRLLESAPVDHILLDSRDAGNAASGGSTLLLSEQDKTAVLDSSKKIMLGGGITEKNVRELLKFFPAYIDVMTGSEDAPGLKSERKIQAIQDAML
ncbi:MAG: hypothetical protein IJL98_04740 [Lachnospiraceae bacterium]|nr:hypothetical protein [Lachnospiraceae bacterium]